MQSMCLPRHPPISDGAFNIVCDEGGAGRGDAMARRNPLTTLAAVLVFGIPRRRAHGRLVSSEVNVLPSQTGGRASQLARMYRQIRPERDPC